MRFFITIILLFVCSAAFAGKPDTTGIYKAVHQLNQALVQKDSAMLKKLLHKKVTYGHSNGWVETKRDVIEDLFNGTLVYNKIDQGALEVTEEQDIVFVRSAADVDVALKGTQIQLKLHILQVWMREKKGWILVSRQSTKI